MSGIEIAGLTLALLPLLISAASNYDRCVTPFSRFKHFPKEAKQFLQLLDVQKVLFHEQCRNLLGNVVNQDVAIAMIKTADHHSWHDIELEAGLAQFLDKSKRGACITTIELISERLQAVESYCQNLSVTLNTHDQTETETANHSSSWKSRTATKLRFSSSKSQLRNYLDDLRTYNYDFRELASPSCTTSKKWQASKGHSPQDVEREINRYATVGKASRQVHEALGQACTKHTEHVAHTCAEVEFTVMNGSEVPWLKFRMALSGSADHKNPLSFIIDTTVEDFYSGADKDVIVNFKGLEETLKRQLDCPSDTAERKAKKNVRFESSAVRAPPVYPTISKKDAFSLDSRTKKDFCDYLRRCSNQDLPPETCMGTLGNKTGCKHFIFPATGHSCSGRQQAVSLGHMLSSLSEPNRLGNFPLYERLRLAKILTVAVLQYHATPWLHGSWRSSDVTFLGDDALSLLHNSSPLKAPHLYARVRGSDNSPGCGTVEKTHAPAAARNPLLYSLGILLLEIGYWKKWEDLSQSGVDGDSEQRNTQLYRARMLLKSGNSDVGPRYDSIVQQLIECDFGFGDDLSTVRLQRAVHRDVICQLDELLRGFREFQLGK